MKIGFFGQLYGKKLRDSISLDNTMNYAIQKFNKNFVIALSLFSDVKVYSPVKHKANKIFSEMDGRTEYRYLFYSGKIGRLILLMNSFLKCFCGSESIYFFDALNISQSVGIILAKKVKKKKAIGIITDIPQDILDGHPGIFGKLFLYILRNCDAMVVLTEQTNLDYNSRKKPYVIVEGIANDLQIYERRTLDKKICIYAGGLLKKYHVDQLAECFSKIAKENEYLHIFGDGESCSNIKHIAESCSQVKYMGTADNQTVVKHEMAATLLINPRTNEGAYTKYSFPSKLIEYMSTGVAVLGNRLDGVPAIYSDYMFLFDGNSDIQCQETLRRILDMDSIELQSIGGRAKDFVLSRNGIQATSHKLKGLLYDMGFKE